MRRDKVYQMIDVRKYSLAHVIKFSEEAELDITIKLKHQTIESLLEDPCTSVARETDALPTIMHDMIGHMPSSPTSLCNGSENEG